jgi:2-oxoglutarate dehydrogenase E2 component (dihydrolipoamide succinyltransferase)
VAEGTIVEWLNRPGDWVDADETVAMVTTDKVDVEIPAPASGRLERILVEADETVPVGTPLAEIDPSAKPGEAHPEEHEEPRESEEEAAAPEPAAQERPAPAPAAETDEGPTARSSIRRWSGGSRASRNRSLLGRGDRPGGRVRKRDVLAQVENGAAEERTLHMESPYRPDEEAEEAPAAAPEAAPAGPAPAAVPGRRERMSPMRRRIAEHMLESRRTSAHCTTIVEVDMGGIAARRAELRNRMERRGVPLTYLSFVAPATVGALERHPILNASIEGEEIVFRDAVNLGIAVALEQGLIVPVIRG